MELVTKRIHLSDGAVTVAWMITGLTVSALLIVAIGFATGVPISW